MRDPSRPWTCQQYFRTLASGRRRREGNEGTKGTENPEKTGPGGEYERGGLRRGVNTEDARTRSLLRRSLAGDLPAQAGRPTAPLGHRQLGQPAAAHSWKEGPSELGKGGASVLRTGGRPHRSRWSLDAASCGRPPVLAVGPATALKLLVKSVGRKSVRVTAVCIGGGSNDKATRPTRRVALRAKGACGGIPSRPSF